MSSITVPLSMSYATTYAWHHQIKNQWVLSSGTTPLRKHIFTRVAFLALVPLSILTLAIDALVCLGLGLAAAGHLGKEQKLNKRFMDYSRAVKRSLCHPYFNLLNAINVYAQPYRLA